MRSSLVHLQFYIGLMKFLRLTHLVIKFNIPVMKKKQKTIEQFLSSTLGIFIIDQFKANREKECQIRQLLPPVKNNGT